MADSDLDDGPDAAMTWDQQVDFKPTSGPPTYQREDFYDSEGRFFAADSSDAAVARSQQLAAESREAGERREANEQCRQDAYSGNPMSSAEAKYCYGYDPSGMPGYDPSQSALDQKPAPTVHAAPWTPGVSEEHGEGHPFEPDGEDPKEAPGDRTWEVPGEGAAD